jgi:hypothetical protein
VEVGHRLSYQQRVAPGAAPFVPVWSIQMAPQRSLACGPFGVAVTVKVAGGPATATTVTV